MNKNKGLEKSREKGIKESLIGFFKDFLVLLLACCLGSFATVSIMIPNGLTCGGITGIARIIQGFINLDFSLLFYGLAFVVLILCLILLGVKEARKIVLMTVMYPAVLMIFEKLDLRLLEQTDMILASTYCGIFTGICSGLILMRGYSSGGTDTIAKIIRVKWLHYVDLSRILMVVDAIIIVASGIVYGRNVALYALITTVICSKVIDIVVFGFQTKIVQVEIISSKNEEISKYIMYEIGRGVTFDTIVGAYTGNESKRLVALCSPRESVLIRQFVAKHDRNALMTILHVDSIWGNGDGFSEIDKE